MEQFLTSVALPFLGSLATALVNVLIAMIMQWISAKTKITVEKAWIEKVQGIVNESVIMIEERAQAELKAGLPKWTSEMKYRGAFDYILSMVPELTKEKADAMIEAALGRIGLGATYGHFDEKAISEK